VTPSRKVGPGYTPENFKDFKYCWLHFSA